jgi:hypothetical protein
MGPENEHQALLDAFYGGRHWHGVVGGTTVASRAVILLRLLGFLRVDLFGVDSCVLGAAHHAYPQAENDGDDVRAFAVSPVDAPDVRRVFRCTPWHIKQFEDFLQVIRVNGAHFLLNVHGDGLLAYALRASADLELRPLTAEEE